VDAVFDRSILAGLQAVEAQHAFIDPDLLGRRACPLTGFLALHAIGTFLIGLANPPYGIFANKTQKCPCRTNEPAIKARDHKIHKQGRQKQNTDKKSSLINSRFYRKKIGKPVCQREDYDAKGSVDKRYRVKQPCQQHCFFI